MYKALVGSLMLGDTITLDVAPDLPIKVVSPPRETRNGRVELTLRFPDHTVETRSFHRDARFVWQP